MTEADLQKIRRANLAAKGEHVCASVEPALPESAEELAAMFFPPLSLEGAVKMLSDMTRDRDWIRFLNEYAHIRWHKYGELFDRQTSLN